LIIISQQTLKKHFANQNHHEEKANIMMLKKYIDEEYKFDLFIISIEKKKEVWTDANHLIDDINYKV
jgi:Zn/Cd-binding protein ZinT